MAEGLLPGQHPFDGFRQPGHVPVQVFGKKGRGHLEASTDHRGNPVVPDPTPGVGQIGDNGDVRPGYDWVSFEVGHPLKPGIMGDGEVEGDFNGCILDGKAGLSVLVRVQRHEDQFQAGLDRDDVQAGVIEIPCNIVPEAAVSKRLGRGIISVDPIGAPGAGDYGPVIDVRAFTNKGKIGGDIYICISIG